MTMHVRMDEAGSCRWWRGRWAGAARALVCALAASGALGQAARAEDAQTRPEPGSLAPGFVLEDAEGAKQDLAAMKGKHVLLLFGSKGLKDENRKWAEALNGCLGKRGDVKLFMVADLRGIPFFISNDFVRGEVRKEKRPVPLLLDWKQVVNRRYGVVAGRLELVAVSPDGKLTLRHQSSAFQPSDYQQVLSALEAVLPAPVCAKLASP